MRLRFSKAARLNRAAEFARLRQEGRSFHGRYMVLSVLVDLPPEAPPRVGIITSKRVGIAVVRNRARRRLREVVRPTLPLLKKGVWFVLVARHLIAKATFSELQREWLQLARRSELLSVECAP